MGKITLTIPNKFEVKLRKEAIKRKVPLNRHISQVLLATPRELLEEIQLLRQKIFVLQTKILDEEKAKNGVEL